MFRKFALAGIASTAALFATPAWADTLIDNVVGITINADGEVERFTGLVISDDGKVRELAKSGDPRPGSIDYQIDGEGRVSADGQYTFDIRILTDGNLDSNVRYVVGLVARKTGPNSYRVNQSGRLPAHIRKQIFH